jgi:hypothetical protein
MPAVCCAGRIKANGTCVAATDPVLGCKTDEVADATGCVSCEKRLPGSVSIIVKPNTGALPNLRCSSSIFE